MVPAGANLGDQPAWLEVSRCRRGLGVADIQAVA
jgi:hypothetical protein